MNLAKLSSRRSFKQWYTLIVFAVTFLILTGYGLYFDQDQPLYRLKTSYREELPKIDSEWFLCNDPEVLDYDIILYNWWGSDKYIQDADVIFMGNSRSVFAFRPEDYTVYLEKLNLKPYKLSFCSGDALIQSKLIERLDLKNKILIINGENFFQRESQFTHNAINRGKWGSFKYILEHNLSWIVRNKIHRIFPPFAEYWLEQKHHIYYRSKKTGAHRWIYSGDEREPGDAPPPLTPKNMEAANKLAAEQNPSDFLEAMKRRNITVFITHVPSPYYDCYYSTVLNQKKYGFNFIDVWPENLKYSGGFHLNRSSASEYCHKFMQELVEMKSFQDAIKSRKTD
jgi:hypothetical protein